MNLNFQFQFFDLKINKYELRIMLSVTSDTM